MECSGVGRGVLGVAPQCRSRRAKQKLQKCHTRRALCACSGSGSVGVCACVCWARVVGEDGLLFGSGSGGVGCVYTNHTHTPTHIREYTTYTNI